MLFGFEPTYDFCVTSTQFARQNVYFIVPTCAKNNNCFMNAGMDSSLLFIELIPSKGVKFEVLAYTSSSAPPSQCSDADMMGSI